MKPKTLLLLLLLSITGIVQAQELEKNIFTIRGGANFSDLKTDYTPTDSKIGIHAGATYERILSKRFPLYLETGLLFSQTGCKNFNDDKINAYILQIPIMINYKFPLAKNLSVYPSAGFYLSMGLGGKIEDSYRQTQTFGEDGNLTRTDFGFKTGITLLWRKILLSAGYELGFNDLNRSEYDYSPDPATQAPRPAWDNSLKHRNFYVSIGYKF